MLVALSFLLPTPHPHGRASRSFPHQHSVPRGAGKQKAALKHPKQVTHTGLRTNPSQLQIPICCPCLTGEIFPSMGRCGAGLGSQLRHSHSLLRSEVRSAGTGQDLFGERVCTSVPARRKPVGPAAQLHCCLFPNRCRHSVQNTCLCALGGTWLWMKAGEVRAGRGESECQLGSQALGCQ